MEKNLCYFFIQVCLDKACIANERRQLLSPSFLAATLTAFRKPTGTDKCEDDVQLSFVEHIIGHRDIQR